MKLYRKAQGWTIDYIVSLLIFIIATIIATNILTNTFSSSDFDNVRTSAITISEHLLTQGYPAEWNAGDVLRIGLTSSKNRISKPKLQNYLDLNYNTTKTLFGTVYDYAFNFEDSNGQTTSIGTECVLGSQEVLENKTFYNDILPTAYYHRATTLMNTYMTPLNADIYDGNNDVDVDNFYALINNYDLVVMEDAEIPEGGTLTNTQKINTLNNYVSNGGILFVSENVSVNISGVGFREIASEVDSTVLVDTDPYLSFIIGREIDDNTANPSFTVEDINSTNFIVLADYDGSGEAFVADWRYGLGKGYYFATIDATYDPPGVALAFNTKIGQGTNAIANETRANCTGNDYSVIQASNLARAERLVIYNSEIIRMVVTAWS